jgi:hypothetical protein
VADGAWAAVAHIDAAAAAEVAALTVLAVDKDFELIAQISGQPAERLRLEQGLWPGARMVLGLGSVQ